MDHIGKSAQRYSALEDGRDGGQDSGATRSAAMRVLDHAAGAPTLASAVNIGAFNLGNALSAWLGGIAIAAGFGYTAPNWVGAVLAASALALAVLSRLQERREVTTHSRVVSASALDTAAVPAARR